MNLSSIASTVPSERSRLKKILLLCGIFSSVFYVATDIFVSRQYEGYRIIDQNYSELLATGAPTRSIMLLMSVVYNSLMAAFAAGIWSSAGPKRTARVAGSMMVVYAILSQVTPTFFQMDMRGAEVTARGGLHPLMTAIMSLFIMLSIGFGAFLLRKRFRIYSFATIVILLVFGFLTAQKTPLLEAGQPTPGMGFTERINIYMTMLWFAILSISLFRLEKRRGTIVP